MRWVALLLLLANAALGGWMLMGTPGRATSVQQPPPEIGHLRLLRESTGDFSKRGVCFTLGPFRKAEKAGAAEQRLTNLGLDATRRQTQDQVVHGYQVLLPPAKTRAQALQTTRELSKQGIEDYFIVSDPPNENAISLGLFEKKRFAERHADYIHKLGFFDARIHVRTREQTHYWEDYRDPGGLVTQQVVRSLEAEQSLQRLRHPCG